MNPTDAVRMKKLQQMSKYHQMTNAQEIELNELENKQLPFDIHALNIMTDGGVRNGTLNVILASPDDDEVKNLTMVHFASEYLIQGANVLFITLNEPTENEIFQRVRANLTGTEIEKIDINIPHIPDTCGRLHVKQFIESADCDDFESLIYDLKLSVDFIPDVVFIDGMNKLESIRYYKDSVASYEFKRYIAEELYSFATEYNVSVWTTLNAAIGNTGDSATADISLMIVPPAYSIISIADFVIGIIHSDDRLLIKKLKSRYCADDMDTAVIGVDPDLMMLYNL